MTAPINPAGGQTPPEPGQASGQTPPTSGQTPTTPPPANGEELMSLEAGRKLRDENKQYRLAKEAAEARLKAIEDAQLSEQQKLARDLEEARTQAKAARERAARAEVKALAGQLGFAHPDDAVALIERHLQIGEDGTATNAKDLLEALKKDRPQYLISQSSSQPTLPTLSPTNPGGQPGKPIFTSAQLEDLDFYVKNRAAIEEAIREGRFQK